MFSLAVSDAIGVVRANLDEIEESSLNAITDTDAKALDALIKRKLPEAINYVHANAPLQMLEGIGLTSTEVALIDLLGDAVTVQVEKKPLRIINVTLAGATPTSRVVPESSPEGRMQLNPYTKGTPENPVIVELNGKYSFNTSGVTVSTYCYRCYSVKVTEAIISNQALAIETFEYIPRVEFIPDATRYDVATSLIDNILDYLTALICNIYGYTDKATFYINKAGFGQQR